MSKLCPKCGINHEKPGIYCSRECANSRKHSIETKLKISIALKSSEKAKINAIKSIKPRILQICPICNKEFSYLKKKIRVRIYCSKECYNKDSECLYRYKSLGGKRAGSGRGKKGWYKNYFCDSSWELAWVIYNLDHNIKFERNKQYYEYLFEGKVLKFYPDFILENNSLIEIKGYKSKQSLFKEKTFQDIKFLYYEDLKEVFKYVENKYGKDYIKLYENNPYNEYTNICKYCGQKCKAKCKYCSKKCSLLANHSSKIKKLNAPVEKW